MFCLKCGEAIPDDSKVCQKCGATIGGSVDNDEPVVVYASQKVENIEINKNEKQEYVPSKKKLYIGIAMCIVACVLFVFSIKNITNNKYKFYVENYDTYVAGYEENSNTASQYSGGLFKSGYNQIASSYKSMADDAKKAIWTYRIKAVAFLGVGVVLVVLGIKKIKRNRILSKE